MSGPLIETPVGTSIDHQAALSRVGGDVELLKEIAGIFLDDYPKVLKELHDAVARGDPHGVERTAHGLKGSVATFGASAAVGAAQELEGMGRTRQLAEVTQVLHTLEVALAALRPELEAL